MNDRTFRPLPFLANPHVQTVGAMLLKRGRFPEPTPRYRVPLPDGDQLVLHENRPTTWRPGDAVAIVVHGLTGSHRSGGVVLQAQRLFQRNVRVFRLDLRGAGAGFALARKLYNAGCSADVRAAVEVVAGLAPMSTITLVGTSLGGNVVLKLTGEASTQPLPQLAGVAALNPPVDLAACTALIAERRNRMYEAHFVADLIRNIRRRSHLLGEAMPHLPRRPTLKQFDDAYTAPRNGFVDADDYYARSSSGQFIPLARVPVLIVSARDDPFVAIEPIEGLAPLPHVQLAISDRGGHTGFLGRDGHGGLGWAETLIAGWVANQVTN